MNPSFLGVRGSVLPRNLKQCHGSRQCHGSDLQALLCHGGKELGVPSWKLCSGAPRALLRRICKYALCKQVAR